MEGNDKIIYLDNAAATPILPEVVSNFGEISKNFFANSSANHAVGVKIRHKISQIEDEILKGFHSSTRKNKIVWTSGGTEANNLAIFGYVKSFSRREKFCAVTTKTEHASIYQPMKKLEGQQATISYVDVDRYGSIDMDSFSDALQFNTNLVSLSHVQNETGVIQDLVKVREIMNERSPNAKFHVDAVQSFGKIDIPFRDAKIDFMTISSHKIHGPGGLGALIIRNDSNTIYPLLLGGDQQENFRSGTLDACSIVGLSLALKKLQSIKKSTFTDIKSLHLRLKSGLLSLIDHQRNHLKIKVNSKEKGSPYILNFSILGYQGAILMRMLGTHGIIVGTGSACSAQRKSPSRVLTAMGLTNGEAYGALRVSFGYQNTQDEVDLFLCKLQAVIRDY